MEHNIYSILTPEDTATGERDGREMANAESQIWEIGVQTQAVTHRMPALTSTDAGVKAIHPMSKTQCTLPNYQSHNKDLSEYTRTHFHLNEAVL